MSVVGKAGSFPGWITQTMVAIRELYTNDIDHVEFEVIDDVGFRKDNEYYSVQVKQDFSGSFGVEKAKEEIKKMKKKGGAITDSVTKVNYSLVISTPNPKDKIKLEKLTKSEGVKLEIVTDIVNETMKSIQSEITRVVIDDYLAWFAGMFVSKKVFEAYESKSKDDVLIKIYKNDVNRFLKSISYETLVGQIFEIEKEIKSSAYTLKTHNKYDSFRKKFSLYDELSYGDMYTQYSLFKKKNISRQLLSNIFFLNVEKETLREYRFDSPSSNAEMKVWWNENIKDGIYFVQKNPDVKTRVDKGIRRGVLINGIEENKGEW